MSPHTPTPRRRFLSRLLLGLIALALCSSVSRAADGFVEISSLAELRPFLAQDGVKVRLTPGTYRLEAATDPNFIDFTGDDSHYDFTGVKLEVPTALYKSIKPGINIVALTGDRIVLNGLALETLGEGYSPGGVRGVSVLGNGVVVKNITVVMRGSFPYGYGSYFGIGSDASVKLSKTSGIRLGGIDNQLLDSRVVMHAFGHGIFIRGTHNAVLKNCHVEGAVRKTDDILAETSGLAFDQGFKQYTGEPIPAGRMTSLSEDGIRAYPDDPTTGRRTTGVTIENCTVTRMRRGICMAFATGEIRITGCKVTECERSSYHIGGGTTIDASSGDALYTQLLDISAPGSKDSRVRITALDTRAAYGNTLLSKINGTGHDVEIVEAEPGAVPSAMTVELGTDRGFGQGRIKDARASRVKLANRTGASVILHEETDACVIRSDGPVTDRGSGNTL